MKKLNKFIFIRCFIFSVILFLIWNFSLSQTFDLMRQHNELKQQSKITKNLPQKKSRLILKNTYLDSILKTFKVDGYSIQNNLLKFINDFSEKNNLQIVSFLEPHRIIENNNTTTTYNFSVSGDYNSINNLIYNLEKSYKYGSIIHVNFSKKLNYRKNLTF